jgi:hypothetical protein
VNDANHDNSITKGAVNDSVVLEYDSL